MTSQPCQLFLFCWMKKTLENSSLMHSFITKLYIDRASFLWPWRKMVSVSISLLVLSVNEYIWNDQNMDSSFSAKENLNM